MKEMRNVECGMWSAIHDPASCARADCFRLPPSALRRSKCGFTLLEVIMALPLLALLSGMVFGILRVSLKTAVETQKMQLENDELNRFITLCRNMFQNLPSTATVKLKITETGTPPMQELTISGVPEAFSFGTNPLSYDDSILGLRPDLAAMEASESSERLFYAALSREDLIPTDPSGNNSPIASTNGEGVAAPDDQGRYWMPLLSGVTSMTWRAYKENEDIWEEEWSSSDLPPLVELNLQLRGRSLPLRAVFALPKTKLTAANPALAPKTSTSSSSSSTNTQQMSNAGGNNSGQRGGEADRGRGERGSDRGRGGDMRGSERGERGGSSESGGRGGPPGGGRPSGGGSAQPGGAGGVSPRGGAAPSGGGR